MTPRERASCPECHADVTYKERYYGVTMFKVEMDEKNNLVLADDAGTDEPDGVIRAYIECDNGHQFVASTDNRGHVITRWAQRRATRSVYEA